MTLSYHLLFNLLTHPSAWLAEPGREERIWVNLGSNSAFVTLFLGWAIMCMGLMKTYSNRVCLLAGV